MRSRKDLLLLVSLTVALGACGDDSPGTGGGGGNGTTGATSTTTTTPASTGSTSTSSSGSGGAGGSGPVGSGGSGGAGGQPDLDKDPATVTDPEECYYEGGGGDNGYYCNAAVIDLSDPIPRDEIEIRIETSYGTVFDALCEEECSDPDVIAFDDPVTALTLMYSPGVPGVPNEHYAPEWVDVEVRRNGILVGAERFEPLDYECKAYSQDDWCWESAPVTLEITSPE